MCVNVIGETQEIAGMKAYVTGPADSKNAVLCIYDIFGMWATTQQGADLLAEAMKTKVVMPDFLRGQPWPVEAFPPRSDEEGKKFGEWLETIGNIQDRLKDIQNVVSALKEQGVQKLGLYGFCGGGKISSLAGKEGSLFVGVAQVHPAFVDPNDGKDLAVPVAFFPSKDEEKKDVDGYWNNFKEAHPELVEKSMFKHYTEMFHGFAAARADLKDETNYFAFQDVYTRLAEFFCNLL